MPVYPPINPAILGQASAQSGAGVWAKFPVLPEWIAGTKKPTVNQLAEFAKEVRIPFGFFFLEQLPQSQNMVPLFRTGSAQPLFDYSPELSQTIADIQRRQDWLLEYLRNEGGSPLAFVGRFNERHAAAAIAEDIRKTLGLSLHWSQGMVNKEAALNYLVGRAEEVGVFVAINGVVGNSAKNLNPDEFKGFVLSNALAPYIFINGKGYPATKTFTLLHELAHIWLDKTAAFDLQRFLPANTPVEELCDAVAAELLLATELLRSAWSETKNKPAPLLQLERRFKVSQVVIARRLLDLGYFSNDQFFGFYNRYKTYWDAKTEEAGGGGNFYANQNYRVGRRFFGLVNGAAASGKLLYTDAYKLTNLYGATFEKYKNQFQG